jgi:hypothetical protein
VSRIPFSAGTLNANPSRKVISGPLTGSASSCTISRDISKPLKNRVIVRHLILETHLSASGAPDVSVFFPIFPFTIDFPVAPKRAVTTFSSYCHQPVIFGGYTDIIYRNLSDFKGGRKMFCPICYHRLALTGHDMVVTTDTSDGAVSTVRKSYQCRNVRCNSIIGDYIWTYNGERFLMHHLERPLETA